MVKLSELLSKLSEFSRIKYNHNKRINEIQREISNSINGLHLIEKELDTKIIENQKIQKYSEETLQQTNNLIRNNQSTHPWLAQAFADLLYLHDSKLSRLLKTKSNPAPKAADTVKAIAMEKRILMRELKEYQYKIKYYEALFPSLEDYIDESDEDIDEVNQVVNTDETLTYITSDEYNRLDAVERNQLALDRYKKRRHSCSHIGKMYERYVGYLYEKNGYNVEYFGIKKKLNDLGRDLICNKDGLQFHVVQCKNWSRKKVIHENVICQLYGTAAKFKIEYRRNNNNLFCDNVTPVFFSTTKLSSTASEFAKELGVVCVVEPMSFEYPMIKCNISSNGDKIYHLPFDQQYDSTIIEKHKGEFYASTVHEAEQKGFRRAKRWSGEN